MMVKLTYKYINTLLEYNSNTGDLIWKITLSSSAPKGTKAGHLNKDGYIEIGIDRKLYYAHRLAWLLYYKKWPKKRIDHKDRIRHHNWIKNLRDRTQSLNNRNTGNWKSNTSGIKGVSWSKLHEKWEVYITVKEKRKYLGLYKDFNAAVYARYEEEEKYNWSKSDKMSPAKQYCIDNQLIVLVKIKKKTKISLDIGLNMCYNRL